MIKEAQLIKLAQSGNSTAFGKLVNRYWNKVFLLTTKYCKLEQDKEDIVQETFIQAWQNIKRFPRNSTFFFWLCKIALNLIYEKRRKERFKTIKVDTSEHLWLPALGKRTFLVAMEDDYSRELLAATIFSSDTTGNNLSVIREVVKR